MKSLIRNNFLVFCFITTGFICIHLSALCQDYIEVKIEDIKGKAIPNFEDTTILRLLYGNYEQTNKRYYFNLGPQEMNDMDSIFMMVNKVFGDNSNKIIYVSGETAASSTMHNYYNQIILLLNKNKSGWLVKDVLIYNDVPDYCEVELKGIFGNYFLINYTTCGIYGGGIYYKKEGYTLFDRKSLNDLKVNFITELSNGASEQCQCDSSDRFVSKYCYSYTGEVKYEYVDSLKSFVFDYSLVRRNAECDWKNENTQTVNQQWYMNMETAFQSNGDILSYWAENVEGKIEMSNSEIIKRLHKN